MPTLTSFWCYRSEEANACKVGFPNLESLELGSCGAINLEVIEFGRDDFNCHLESLDISCDSYIQLPCKWQLRLYNLKWLKLSRCWWHELKSACFQRLEELQVHYSRCSTLFAFSDFKGLQQLQTLIISNCAFLEEIVEDAQISGMNKITTLSNLKSVALEDLPKLKSFIRGANYECRMPNLSYVSVSNCGLSSLFMCSALGNLQRLEEIRVLDCRLFEGIFEYARGDETSDLGEQIFTLSQLSSVYFKDLPDLKSFIHGENYDWNIPALEWMGVENCGFSTIFTCSVLRNLQQLKTLKVSNCRLLESIVADAGDDETSDTNEKTITLPQLEKIELQHLPNLKSFGHTQRYAFNMPKLQFFYLFGCPRVKNFTCLNTNTRRGYVDTDCHQWEEVQDLGYLENDGRRWKVVPDLNDYIKRMLKEEVIEVTVLDNGVISDQV